MYALVVFVVPAMPEAITDVWIKQEGFKNIYRSRSAFSLFKEGVDNDRFMLSKTNDYQIHVSLEGNQVLLAKTLWTGSRTVLPLAALLVCFFGVLLYQSAKRFKLGLDG